jgi:voltage-gated potassium channel
VATGLPSIDKTTLRWRLSRWFDDDPSHSNRAARIFNVLLAVLIIANVITVVLETVEPIRNRYFVAFSLAEHAATAFFSVEYILRLWTAVDLRGGQFAHPIWGRLRYMRSFFAVIDLVAVLPALLGFLGADDLRVLRLLRLLRMLKLTRHSRVFNLLWGVFRAEAPTIGALVFILCLTLTISGALAYMVEGEEQPAAFSSIPASMWWAIETLTTVGYGDMVPVTAIGKILGGIVSIVGIGTLALFSGVITVGFLDQLRVVREQAAVSSQRIAVTNGKDGVAFRDAHVLMDLANAGRERRVEGAPAPSAGELCPCCGRPMLSAGSEAALRA